MFILRVTFFFLLICQSSWAAPVRVLLTGFESFAGSPENTSRIIVETFRAGLAKKPLTHEILLETRTLPVVYGKAEAALGQVLKEFEPEITLSFGEYGGSELRLEARAQNRDGSWAEDNEGVAHSDLSIPIIEGEEAELASSLPLEDLVSVLAKKHYPVSISQDAGDYLCNHLFFHLMHSTRKQGSARYAGFIHVPAPVVATKAAYAKTGRWGANAVRLILNRLLAAF
jgi:pyroglutamyl-peptidase